MATSTYIDRIINANCIEVMDDFNDASVDLAVTSPPYDNLREYSSYHFNLEGIVKSLHRIIKEGGVVVWVVADATVDGSETDSSFKQALLFMEIGFRLHDTMIFRKRNPIPQVYRKRYCNEFEYMFVFSKGGVKTHNPIMTDCLPAGLELNGTTYKNYSKANQVRKKLAKPVKAQKIRGNIWEYVVGKNKEDQEAKGHPAPFPCQLAEDHILSWSNSGDIVLDPMCGSGTVCKVAKALGRYFIGIDISTEYCRIASARVSKTERRATQDVLQLELSHCHREDEVLATSGLGGGTSERSRGQSAQRAIPEPTPALFQQDR
jgi:site-specific DNA-methyltransferase (adenine-specific)